MYNESVFIEKALQLRIGAYLYVTSLEVDLEKIDKYVFQQRPDLILHLYSSEKYTEQYLSNIANLKCVRNIAIHLKKHQNIDIFSRLEKMNSIEIENPNCTLEFITNMKHLESLKIYGNIKDYSVISNCKSLKNLFITRSKIENLDFLANTNIEHLMLCECRIDNFASIKKHQSLKILNLSGNHNLDNIDCISEIEQIQKLKISQSKMTHLPNLSSLKNLKELLLTGMKSLVDISSLKTANHIEKLYLNEIGTKVKKDDFMVLTEMQSLKELYIDFLDYTKRTDVVKKMMADNGKAYILKEGILT